MSLNKRSQAQVNRWEEKRAKALASRDAVEYARAIEWLGRDPFDQRLYERGLVELEVERKESVERANRKARGTKIDYGIFKQELETHPYIDPNAIFGNTNEKLDVLVEAGYTHVNGRGGVRIDIHDASPAQLGNVFLSAYNQAFGRDRR